MSPCRKWRAGLRLARRKNITQVALEALHDLLKSPQRDALLTLFQPMQSGRWQAKFSGEISKGHFAALGAEKFAQLLFQRIRHAGILVSVSFRLWNKSLTATQRMTG